MIVGIDGTGSYDESAYEDLNRQSFVRRTIDETTQTYRRYFRGPYTFGLGCERIAQDAARYIRAVHTASKQPQPIFLVGHSRGAAICVRVAKMFATREPSPLPGPSALTVLPAVPTYLTQPSPASPRPSPKSAENPWLSLSIDAMFLFDAVNMSTTISAACIPWNVKRTCHAIRSPVIGSRPEFGNCALQAEPPGVLHKLIFACTHAACGGTPWTGDHPTRAQPSLMGAGGPGEIVVPTITAAGDKSGSEAVWKWMSAWMKLLGAL